MSGRRTRRRLRRRDPLKRLEQFDALATPSETPGDPEPPSGTDSATSKARTKTSGARATRGPTRSDDGLVVAGVLTEPPRRRQPSDESGDSGAAGSVVEEPKLDLGGLEIHPSRRARRGIWPFRRVTAHPVGDGVAPKTAVVATTDEVPAAGRAADADDGSQQLVLDPEGPLVGVAPSTISTPDLVNEAIAGLFSRPSRTILTVLGTMIGLTALVATLGLSRSAGNQIVGRFDEIAATEVDVTPRPVDLAADFLSDLPWDASARVRQLNGVVAAGTLAKVDVGNALISATPVNDPQHQTAFKLGVSAVSPSLFKAVRATLGEGRFFDAGNSRRGDRVAVLGGDAAARLGVGDLSTLPAISIGDEPFLVIGIVDSVARVDKLMSSVMIPEGTARQMYHLRAPDTVVIETRIGANGLIAGQAPTAIRPDHPRVLKVTAQPDLTQVKADVSGDLDLLFLMLGAVSLLVGAIGIANVTLVSVMERTGEIGLRRALGATRRHVAQQFLVESTAMGFVGGILGASLGIVIVVAVSAFQGWTPVVDPWIPFVAPVIGGLIGLAAGSYPARRAASLEPVEALRSGT
jgi:ABC-type antimicrobial peptide transport system permease subunit